jgi:hypothetical protein
MSELDNITDLLQMEYSKTLSTLSDLPNKCDYLDEYEYNYDHIWNNSRLSTLAWVIDKIKV